MDFYQVCLNGGPGVQNGPAAGGLGFKNEIYFQIFFSRTAWLRCLKFGIFKNLLLQNHLAKMFEI